MFKPTSPAPKQPEYEVELYPELGESAETKKESDSPERPMNFTTKHGMEVAVVYLHELCELE